MEDEAWILELDRGDSAPYIFDRKNRVYVPPFSFANYLKISYLQKFSTFGIFTFITYSYTLNIYKKKVVILRRIWKRALLHAYQIYISFARGNYHGKSP